MSNNPEQREISPEANIDSRETATEQIEKLNSAEQGVESPRDTEANEKKARIEALKTAISVEAGGKEKTHSPRDSSPAHRRGPISKSQKEASFKKQMKEVQAELTPGGRVFSKIIHNKAVEKTSDAVGATIARPNAILAGAVCAFVLTLAVYVVAKTIGYKLSGFETIAAFGIGWIIGITYDYLRLIITGKK